MLRQTKLLEWKTKDVDYVNNSVYLKILKTYQLCRPQKTNRPKNKQHKTSPPIRAAVTLLLPRFTF